MIPVTFEQSNFVFTKPNDITDEQYSSLPVYKGLSNNGFPVITSCWQFTKQDLEEIKRTGCISDLQGDFNAHWATKTVVMCDEAKIDKHQVVERIKMLSTAQKIFLNAKGRGQVELD